MGGLVRWDKWCVERRLVMGWVLVLVWWVELLTRAGQLHSWTGWMADSLILEHRCTFQPLNLDFATLPTPSLSSVLLFLFLQSSAQTVPALHATGAKSKLISATAKDAPVGTAHLTPHLVLSLAVVTSP